MYAKNRSLLAVSLFLNSVRSEYLTTINPCPQNPKNKDIITVTAQYQAVSTCVPQPDDHDKYDYTTYDWVSTEVPCQPDGTVVSTVTVTDTAQWVTLTKYAEVTTTAKLPDGKEVEEYIERQGVCQYKDLGELAVWGWEGSGLCKDCRKDGYRWQKVHMQECRRHSEGRSCYEYDDYWVQEIVDLPEVTDIVYPVCATKSVVYGPGTYTWAFPQPAYTKVINKPNGGEPVHVTRPAWNYYITKTWWGGQTTYDFTTTVTKTVTVIWPYKTDKPTITYTVPSPPPTGWPKPGRPDPIITYQPPSGPYTTLTITPGATYVGSATTTLTIALPTGTKPGTVVVLDPGATGTASPTIQPTGPYVTISVTPTGSAAITDSATYTIPPSGTSPGTVIVVLPTSGSGLSTVTTTSNGIPTTFVTTTGPSGSSSTIVTTINGTPTTIISAQPTLTTITTTSNGTPTTIVSTQPTLTSITTNVSGTPTTIVTQQPTLTSITTTINGTPTTLVVNDLGRTSITTTINGTPTTIVTSAPSSSSFTTITTVVGGTTTTAVIPCFGLLCVGVDAGGIGITATVLPGSSSTGGNTVDPNLGSTTCVGLACVSVGASVTGGIGATVTAVIGGTSSPCVGILCAGVGASVTDVIGATVTAVVGGTSTPCVGILCAGVGASVTNVIGATVTGVVGGTSSPCVGILCAGVGASVTDIIGVSITAGGGGATPTSGQTTTLCNGILCVSVGASVLPVGATVTGVLGGGGLTVSATAGGNNGAAATPATDSAAATTQCVGALCVSLGVSVLPVSATVTLGLNSNGVGVSATAGLGGNTAAVTTPATSPPQTSCVGLLCVSVGASLPIASVTVTAGVNSGVAASATVNAPVVSTVAVVVSVQPQQPAATTQPQQAAATTQCVGLLCASVGVSVPIVQATVTAVVLPTSGGVAVVSATARVTKRAGDMVEVRMIGANGLPFNGRIVGKREMLD